MDQIEFQKGGQVVYVGPEGRLVFFRNPIYGKVDITAFFVVTSGTRAEKNDFIRMVFFAKKGNEMKYLFHTIPPRLFKTLY